MPLAQNFVVVEPNRHAIKTFDCGKPDMDRFLVRFAVKHTKLGISRTWVLPVLGEQRQPVAAYYTLAASTVEREDIPFEKSLPTYPVPVVLLARLAVDRRFQGLRLGEKTLITALRKSVELTDNGLPAVGVILDVLDEDALEFYQCFKIFEPFTTDPMRLFVPLSVVRQI